MMRRQQALLGFHALLTLCLWGWIAVFAPRGFDLTDNGFYLLNYLRYDDLIVEVSWFGGILTYLYQAVGQSAEAMRAAGMGITLALGILTASTVLRFAQTRGMIEQETKAHALLTMTNGSVLAYSLWLTTPSYNTLVLWGAMISLIGLLTWIQAQAHQQQAISAVSLGVGVGFMAMGKLPTLLPLAMVSCLLLWLFGVTWRRILHPISIISGLLGVGCVLILTLAQHRSLQYFLEKPALALTRHKLIFQNDEIALAQFLLHPLTQLIVLLIELLQYALLLALWGVLGALLARLLRRRPAFVFAFVGLGMIMLSILWIERTWSLGMFGALLLLWTLTVAAIEAWYQPERRALLHKLPLLFALLLAGFALAAVYGTDGRYTRSVNFYGAFWVLGAVVLACAWVSAQRRPALLVLFSCALLIFIVGRSASPYRQAVPVWQMDARVSLRNGAESVWVDSALADYLHRLQTTAYAQGFVSNQTPLIDLTGEAPGAVYALGGRAYGFAWLLGGYVGSDQAATFMLGLWPEAELRRAWVLQAVNGERSLSLSVLTAHGLPFPEAYELVGSLELADEVVHRLYRPTIHP